MSVYHYQWAERALTKTTNKFCRSVTKFYMLPLYSVFNLLGIYIPY